jgi:hypothetical protein
MMSESAAGPAAPRWLGVGGSDHPDPRRAGVEAATAALAGGGSPNPGAEPAAEPGAEPAAELTANPGAGRADAKLLIVFCAGDRDPAAVLAGINEASGGVPLIGCSTGAEFVADGPSQGRVVVTALGGPGFTVSTAAATGAGSRQRETGAAVAGCAVGVEDAEHVALVLLTDGLAGDQEEILRGAYDVVGAAVPLVGGSASPGAARQTFHLHGNEVLTDAVVAAAIGSDAPFGIGVRHGWRKVGEPMIVTRSTKGRVYTLDDKPALDTYLARFDAPAEVRRDPVAFDLFSRTRPLGVRRRVGEEVRNVSSTEYLADGWLGCSGDVPEGGLVWLMEGDEDSVIAAAGDACDAAVEALGDHRPIGFLAFDCASRSGLLGTDGTRREVRRMVEQVGTAPLAGFYTWGEIARSRGINGYHHQTLVVLAVS